MSRSYWTSADGRRVLIRNMTNAHLLNAILFIEDTVEAIASMVKEDAIAALPTEELDIALQDALEREIESAEIHPEAVRPIHSALLLEADRRLLDISKARAWRDG
jgi:hypothetical protein